jgi:hypothetical protein
MTVVCCANVVAHHVGVLVTLPQLVVDRPLQLCKLLAAKQNHKAVFTHVCLGDLSVSAFIRRGHPA